MGHVRILQKVRNLASRVKKVITSEEFKVSYRRGVLISITLVVVTTIKRKIVYAVDNDFLYTFPKEKEPLHIHPTHNWRERLFSKKYGLSNAGLATGIITVGISGFYIYNLYNENLLLHGQNIFLKKAQTTLQLTIHRGALALARSNKAIEVLEKTLTSTVQGMDMLM